MLMWLVINDGFKSDISLNNQIAPLQRYDKLITATGKHEIGVRMLHIVL